MNVWIIHVMIFVWESRST